MAEELITKWLDEGSAVDLIYPDFSKAFDSVNHRLLLDVVLSWIECLLSRRKFKVSVNGTLSQMAEAISGAAECSVIRPIIFVIYVNDPTAC